VKLQATGDEDGISLWLKDSVQQTESVVNAAPEMGWTPEQLQELKSELEFFRALVSETTPVPRPPERVLKLVRRAIRRWQRAVDWSADRTLDANQAAHQRALADRLQRLRASLASVT
jgi:hypothetical protein